MGLPLPAFDCCLRPACNQTPVLRAHTMHIELTYGPEGEQTKVIELTKLPSQLGLLQMRAAQARVGAMAQGLQSPSPKEEGDDSPITYDAESIARQVDITAQMLAQYHALIKPYVSEDDMDWICDQLPIQAVIGVTEAIISTREVPAALQGKSAARLKR